MRKRGDDGTLRSYDTASALGEVGGDEEDGVGRGGKYVAEVHRLTLPGVGGETVGQQQVGAARRLLELEQVVDDARGHLRGALVLQVVDDGNAGERYPRTPLLACLLCRGRLALRRLLACAQRLRALRRHGATATRREPGHGAD
nr:unnamed protein product [Digitaria exilis]